MGHLRKPAESDIDFSKRRAFETGQLWGPQNKDGPNIKPGDLKKLKPFDSAMRDAFSGLAKMMVRTYAPSFAKHYGTVPDLDDVKIDAALLETMETPRCEVPDYAPPPGASFLFDDPLVQQVAEEMQRVVAKAIGRNGNWPRCHGAGDFHSSIIQIDETHRPAWMTDAILIPVLRNTEQAYWAIGSHVIFVNKNMKGYVDGKDYYGHHVDVKSSWVPSSTSWIGLAILTLGLGCSDEIWQRYLNTYKGGSPPEIIIRQNTKLFIHETGHNHGLPHTNGFIMNPSILNDEQITWTPADPSTAKLKMEYGGFPDPKWTGGGGGDGTPPPVAPIEQRIKSLEDKEFQDNLTNAMQDVKYALLEGRVKKLENRS